MKRDVSVGVDVLQGCLPGTARRRPSAEHPVGCTHEHPHERRPPPPSNRPRDEAGVSRAILRVWASILHTGLPFYTRRQHPPTVSETGGKSKGQHCRKHNFSGLGRLERLGDGRRGSLQLGLSLDTGLLLGVKLVSWREGYHNRRARAGGGGTSLG